MPAYLIGVAKVTKADAAWKTYLKRAHALATSLGGEYLTRGPADIVYEGSLFTEHSIVLVRFETLEGLRKFFESEEYQKELIPLRASSAVIDIGAFVGPKELKIRGSGPESDATVAHSAGEKRG